MCALAMELTLERRPKVMQKSLQLLISYWQWIAFAHCISYHLIGETLKTVEIQ